ncbi:MAG: ATP-dependent DNA helicase RecG [Ignavibacteriae bacterium]|nr:ATP-dependent DNA helicase RecG [Ignavibacteriota bacterium]
MKDNKPLALQYIRGVGPKRAEVLASAGLLTAADMLRYYPRSYIDRNTVVTLAELTQTLRRDTLFSNDSPKLSGDFSVKNEITVVARISKIRENSYGGGSRSMMIISLSDESGGSADMIFFQMIHYFRIAFKVGMLVVVSGMPEYEEKFRKVSFHHPEVLKIDEEDEELYKEGKIIPKYKITQAMKNVHLSMRHIRSIVEEVIEQEIPKLRETLPSPILRKLSLPNIREASRMLHFPDSTASVERARFRMKFEELFFFEMMLALRKRGIKVMERGVIIDPKSTRARGLLDALPFELTHAQKRVIWEIATDFQSGKPMNRLLQGDVGSGKTLVALFAMLMAIDAGYQTLLMAPTEILAEQHYHTLKNFLEGSGIEIVQLIGGQKAKMRRDIKEKIALGKAHIIIGTHALFSGNATDASRTVDYHKVGLIVVDEQHRFGVMQRAKLRDLGIRSHVPDATPTLPISPHILVMSATPIPRTLSMTLYGDLDISIIDQMPYGRKPIRTEVIFESKLDTTMEFIRSEVRNGKQAYIVYPLVEKSDKIDLKSAVEHFEHLQHEVFPEFKLGLLHGQMFWYEKDDAMRAFKNKEFQILVATTVVEVGIDIPNATVMLIENAERFGLSQLHQLRGRVGRGGEQSYCFLATKDHFRFLLGKKEQEASERKASIIRLKTMEETTDGFKIAEVDMKLRGPGDVMGTRQSGVPDFEFTDLVRDFEVIEIAKREAFALIDADPHLRKPEHEQTRIEFLRQYAGEKGYFDVA